MTKLPIAEHFVSLQGEGVYAGTPMLFVRLAGCNVGGSPEYGKCWTWDGREFQCDTNYRRAADMTLPELLHRPDRARVHRICITGGEPLLLHKPLFQALQEIDRVAVHIETSGTVAFPNWLQLLAWTQAETMPPNHKWIWITCSPKRGFLPKNAPFISEWKFLVDENFPFNDPETAIRNVIGDSEAPVFLQPINGLHNVNPSNLGLCKQLLAAHPRWRLSMQLHKILGMQ